MKRKTQRHTRLAACAAAACLALSQTAPITPAQQPPTPQSAAAARITEQSPAAKAFEERVRGYVEMREGIEEKMPKLSKEATPEQITAHKTAFQAAVRSARAGSLPGEMFTRDAAALIRKVMRRALDGKDKAELRQTVFEAQTQGVPLRVNYPYPESKELVEMPPTLLLALPQLPKQMRYRFVGRNLLLVDRENGLIIDYMTNALP